MIPEIAVRELGNEEGVIEVERTIVIEPVDFVNGIINTEGTVSGECVDGITGENGDHRNLGLFRQLRGLAQSPLTFWEETDEKDDDETRESKSRVKTSH